MKIYDFCIFKEIYFNMKNIVVLGSSGHSKVIIDIIEKIGKYNIVGIIDKNQEKGKDFFNYKIIGHDENIIELTEEYDIECGIVGIGDNLIRKNVVNYIKHLKSDFKFTSLIHPNSSIAKKVVVGEGTVVMSGVSINSDSKIGNQCIINTNSSVDHDCIIGDYVSISPNSCLGGNVNIGNNSFVGLGTNIINNINIGNNNIIGSSSLVIRDIKNNIFGYGVPFKERKK